MMTQVTKQPGSSVRRTLGGASAKPAPRRTLSPKQASTRRRPVDDRLDPEFFKALGDPTRVRLLGCLIKCGRACSVTDVAACCAVDLSVVSRHLKMLEEAGMLTSTKRGRTVWYAVRYRDLCDNLRALAASIEQCCPEGCSAACGAGGSCGASACGCAAGGCGNG